MPVDLHLTLELPSLDTGVEVAFWRLFAQARSLPPMIGYLVDDALEALSTARLARTACIPRSTMRRHLSALDERGLVRRDRHHRFLPCYRAIYGTDGSTLNGSDDGTTACEQLALFDLPRPVENPRWGVAPHPAGTLRGGHSYGQGGWPQLWPPQRHKEVRDVRRETAVPEPRAVHVENRDLEPAGLARDVGPPIDLVPEILRGTQAGYLLARLAEEHEAWAGALSSDRDLRDLATLASRDLGSLTVALEQQRLSPTARQPLAWLHRTVRELAAGSEVAS